MLRSALMLLLMIMMTAIAGATSGPSVTTEPSTDGEPITLVNFRCEQPDNYFCKELIPTMSADIQQRVERHLNAAYQGQMVRVIASPSPSSLKDTVDAEGIFQAPVCDQNEGEPLGIPESHHCEFSCTGNRTSGVSCSIGDPKSCELERAWFRGALIHEVRLARTALLEEIQQTRMLKVGPTCDSGLRNPEFAGVVAATAKELIAWRQVNGTRALVCDRLPQVPQPLASITSVDDPRVPKQAGCHLLGAITAIQEAVAEAAVCEVFARGEKAWLEDDAEDFQITLQLTAQIAAGRCLTAASVTRCMNSLYGSSIGPALKKFTADFDDDDFPAPPAGGALVAVDAAKSTTQCPLEAPDCKKCEDPISCGTHTPFELAELGALAAFDVDLKAAESMVQNAALFLPKGPSGPTALSPLTPNATGTSFGLPPGVGPSPSPSPSPSPAPTRILPVLMPASSELPLELQFLPTKKRLK